MSTPITLTVGDITLTYDTTYIGIDHGMLFKETDRRRRRHGSIDYDYYEQNPGEDVTQSEMCFCRPLRYDEHHAKRGLFASEPAIAQLPVGDACRDTGGYSERSHFGTLLGFLDPYSILRVLAENPANLDLEVVWDYGNFVDAGWAQNSDFVAGARRTQTYLIATEGTSDIHILKRAIALLRSDIQDFFRFIEVEDRHPFSGTGNLAKFAEGLVKIDVHNRVVFLFDNDAEGHDAYRSLQRFAFPVNMRAMVLPDLEELRNFPVRGPDGVSSADINGRAAAIECYLDLRSKDRKQPQVTWTNYKEKLDVYQGALDFKESYANAFFDATVESITSNEYDVRKLRIVLDALQHQCVKIAEQMLPIAQHTCAATMKATGQISENSHPRSSWRQRPIRQTNPMLPSA